MRSRGDRRQITIAVLCALTLSLLAGCTPPPPQHDLTTKTAAASAQLVNDHHPLNDRLWHRESGQFITTHDALNHMARARFVLLGELHDNARHHDLQNWIIRALGERNNKRALAVEMIADDQIPALKLFYEQPRHNAETLRVFLQWDKSSWPTWDYYGSIFDTAVLVEYPIRAANLDRTLLKDLHQNGWQALPPQTRDDLQLPAAIPEPLGQALRTTIADAHCGHLSSDFVSAFAEIQFARDARMAKAMGDDRASILIAGLEHVRRDRGVPFHLMRMKYKGDVISVAFIETIDGKTDPSAYDLPYDIVWFTSGPKRSDPCKD